jgi:hypothetical protein
VSSPEGDDNKIVAFNFCWARLKKNMFFFKVTSDFQIGSVGRELLLFFQIFFFNHKCVLKTEIRGYKCYYSIGKLNQRAVKAFTALWLALFLHSNRNSPKQK